MSQSEPGLNLPRRNADNPTGMYRLRLKAPPRRQSQLLRMLASLALCVVAAAALETFAYADKVRLLVTDETRLQAHFDVVDHAVDELDVSFAFFHDDDVSRAFLNKLVDAADRGVKVRFLLDGLNNALPRKLVAYLIHNGIQVRFYHYISLNPKTWSAKVSWIWKRMHDKQVVADRWRLIAGTENMGGPYYKTLVPPSKSHNKGFRGRNMLIEGSSASFSQDYYNAVWNSRDVMPPPYSLNLTPEQWQVQERLLTRASFNLLNFSQLPVEGLAPDPALEFEIEAQSVQFVSKLGDLEGGSGGLEHTIVEMIKGAKTRIIIETPYLLLSPELADLLIAKATQDHVEITIYTNSRKSNNHPTGNPLYQTAAQDISKTPGITVQEWTGTETLHGKTVIVDLDQVLISSFNFNLRSIEHDSESGVYMRSKKATAATEGDLQIHRFEKLQQPGFISKCSLKFLESLLIPSKSQW